MLLVRVGSRLLGRPSERTLAALAGRDRPGMTIALPSLPADSLQAGRDAFTAGRYADALHHFGQVLAHNPEHPWAWHGRGDALQLMGAAAAALDAYDRAAALQPDEPLHQQGRRNALTALGRQVL